MDVSIAKPSLLLSSRGQAAFRVGSHRILWNIISNMWYPETNVDGCVSVGIAEKIPMHDILLEYLHTKISISSNYLTYNEGSMGSTRT